MVCQGALMRIQKVAAVTAVGILSVVSLTACSSSPGPGTTKTWCDHGNRLYSLDTEDTKGETLAVVPESFDCISLPSPGGNSRTVTTIRPEGDTRPMPPITKGFTGPYKPYQAPAVPKLPTPPKLSKLTPYRLSPKAR